MSVRSVGWPLNKSGNVFMESGLTYRWIKEYMYGKWINFSRQSTRSNNVSIESGLNYRARVINKNNVYTESGLTHKQTK